MKVQKWVWRLPFASRRFTTGQLRALQGIADRKAQECGPGYEATTAEQGRFGGGRVAVVTTTVQAMRAEAKHHHLARH